MPLLYKVNCDSVSYKAENTAIFKAYNRMHCWLVRCGGIIHNTYLSLWIFIVFCLYYRGYEKKIIFQFRRIPGEHPTFSVFQTCVTSHIIYDWRAQVGRNATTPEIHNVLVARTPTRSEGRSAEMADAIIHFPCLCADPRLKIALSSFCGLPVHGR